LGGERVAEAVLERRALSRLRPAGGPQVIVEACGEQTSIRAIPLARRQIDRAVLAILLPAVVARDARDIAPRPADLAFLPLGGAAGLVACEGRVASRSLIEIMGRGGRGIRRGARRCGRQRGADQDRNAARRIFEDAHVVVLRPRGQQSTYRAAASRTAQNHG